MWSDLDDATATTDDSDDGEADAGWRADKHGTYTAVVSTTVWSHM